MKNLNSSNDLILRNLIGTSLIKSFSLLLLIFLSTDIMHAQVYSTYATPLVIDASDDATIDPSALFELDSDSKGLLLPRMTFQERQLIENPAYGLMIFQENNGVGIYYYDATKWLQILSINDEVPDSEEGGEIVNVEDVIADNQDLILINKVGNVYTIGNQNSSATIQIDVTDSDNSATNELTDLVYNPAKHELSLANPATADSVIDLSGLVGPFVLNKTEVINEEQAQNLKNGETPSAGIVTNIKNDAHYNDNFVFGSDSLHNVAGDKDDIRLTFDKNSGAFRVGKDDDDVWSTELSGELSIAAGGKDNQASGVNSAIIGGEGNTVGVITEEEQEATANAKSNSSQSYNGAIVGGEDNTSSGDNTVVIGGEDNIAGPDIDVKEVELSTKKSGRRDLKDCFDCEETSADNAAVIGGEENEARNDNAIVGGGEYNDAEGPNSAVIGGYSNEAISYNATVIGGYGNVAGQEQSQENLPDDDPEGKPLKDSGSNNGVNATVVGGEYNYSIGNNTTVIGGYENTAGIYEDSECKGCEIDLSKSDGPEGQRPPSSDNAAIIGGEYNTALGENSSVMGGNRNTIGLPPPPMMPEGPDPRIDEGQQGTPRPVPSANSVIVGGENNNIAGNNSLVTGVGNVADEDGQVVIGRFNQFINNDSPEPINCDQQYTICYNQCGDDYSQCFSICMEDVGCQGDLANEAMSNEGVPLNMTTDGQLFIIGNGTNPADRSNAMEVYESGRTVINYKESEPNDPMEPYTFSGLSKNNSNSTCITLNEIDFPLPCKFTQEEMMSQLDQNVLRDCIENSQGTSSCQECLEQALQACMDKSFALEVNKGGIVINMPEGSDIPINGTPENDYIMPINETAEVGISTALEVNNGAVVINLPEQAPSTPVNSTSNSCVMLGDVRLNTPCKFSQEDFNSQVDGSILLACLDQGQIVTCQECLEQAQQACLETEETPVIAVEVNNGGVDITSGSLSMGLGNSATHNAQTVMGQYADVDVSIEECNGVDINDFITQNSVGCKLLSSHFGKTMDPTIFQDCFNGHNCVECIDLAICDEDNDNTAGKKLMVVGNGESQEDRSNALEVYESGKTIINIREGNFDIPINGTPNNNFGIPINGTATTALEVNGGGVEINMGIPINGTPSTGVNLGTAIKITNGTLQLATMNRYDIDLGDQSNGSMFYDENEGCMHIQGNRGWLSLCNNNSSESVNNMLNRISALESSTPTSPTDDSNNKRNGVKATPEVNGILTEQVSQLTAENSMLKQRLSDLERKLDHLVKSLSNVDSATATNSSMDDIDGNK